MIRRPGVDALLQVLCRQRAHVGNTLLPNAYFASSNSREASCHAAHYTTFCFKAD